MLMKMIYQGSRYNKSRLKIHVDQILRQCRLAFQGKFLIGVEVNGSKAAVRKITSQSVGGNKANLGFFNGEWRGVEE
jgi:hypothetical protein